MINASRCILLENMCAVPDHRLQHAFTLWMPAARSVIGIVLTPDTPFFKGQLGDGRGGGQLLLTLHLCYFLLCAACTARRRALGCAVAVVWLYLSLGYQQCQLGTFGNSKVLFRALAVCTPCTVCLNTISCGNTLRIDGETCSHED